MARGREPRKVLTVEELEVALASDDPLVVILRGMIGIEARLDAGLNERLQPGHKLEVESLSFALKVDLGIALGLLPPDVRPVLTVLNANRNKFAHGWKASFTKQDARDLVNSWTPMVEHVAGDRTTDPPIGALRRALGAADAIVRGGVEAARDAEAFSAAVHEITRDALEGRAASWRERGLKPSEAAKEAVEAARQARRVAESTGP